MIFTKAHRRRRGPISIHLEDACGPISVCIPMVCYTAEYECTRMNHDTPDPIPEVVNCMGVWSICCMDDNLTLTTAEDDKI